MSRVFDAAFADAARVLESFRADVNIQTTLEAVASLLAAAFRAGGRVYACGNGGSLCDAAHFAEEFSGRFRNDRDALPAMAFTDSAHLTCVANDYGYEFVFSRMIDAFGQPGDVLVVLSTSGNSPTILRAAESARSKGVTVVGFLGKGGGDVLPLCDHAVVVPGETSDRIQELHMLCLHAVIEAVEHELGYVS